MRVPAATATQTVPALQVEALVKRYDQRTVLQEVSLALAPGERVALMGPSGSGKSTLLNCISGIDRPDAGRVVVAGTDLGSMDSDGVTALRRQAIGTIFQFFHLLPTLTAAENVAFPLQLLGQGPAEREQRVRVLLDAVHMQPRADAFPGQLSGGERQRIAIARALAPQPRLILADEPTGNLDSTNGEAILDLLQRLTDADETALLMVTHSAATTRICERTLHLVDGVLSQS